MDNAEPLYTWVHISDLHFGYPEVGAQHDQKMVLARLQEDIGTHATRDVPKPNVVLVTGDIAYSGGGLSSASRLPVEYEQADSWLGSLGTMLGLGKRDINLVPGNHDVQREPSNSHLRRLLTALRTGAESVDTALSTKDDGRLLLDRFANYHAFASSYGAVDEFSNLSLHWIHEVRGLPLKLSLIGLNTALTAQDDSDRGNLLVGKAQLSIASELINQPQPQCAIILTHHPLDWLHESDEIAGWLESFQCLHLSGHMHSNSSAFSRRGSGNKLIHVSAGAAHGHDENPSKHGYNIASLMKSGATTFIRVWPRLWAHDVKGFRLDPVNVPDQQQFVDYPFEGRPAGQLNDSTLPRRIAITVDDKPRERTSAGLVAVRLIRARSGSDIPPYRPAWVGRESELSCAGDGRFQVVAITGIGGQGKSVLAAEHLERSMKSGRYEAWDWRDCREEGDTLVTHFVRIVERFGSFSATPRELAGLTANELALVVADIVAEQPCLFVFDNVDHYVDVDADKTIGSLDILVRDILRRPTRGRLIFTCRPKIHYEEQTYFHLPLKGLSPADTLQLFIVRETKISDTQFRKQIERACQITSGHPLWLNLIAVQVAKQDANLREMLDRIEHGQATELPMRTLEAIWTTLKDVQKNLLRLMAEIVRPESEERVGQLAEQDMKWNRFGKALRSLRAIDLIVTKRTPGSPDLLELHPLIREYIRRQYPRQERKRFIARIASVLDLLIVKLKPKLAETSEFSTLDIWTARAELALNAGLHEEAIATIVEVQPSLIAGGFVEEFTRIALRICRELD